mmetsp:Transcript_39575/g.40330  ORF Transcript_39575/g.40330 Transcript_39575/m.40330 type:complete len:347 (+) Transcript_39575:83-1123(+)
MATLEYSEDPVFGMVKRSAEMFRDSNPYIPMPFQPSRNIKMALKRKANYSLPESTFQIYNQTSAAKDAESSTLLLTSSDTVQSDSDATLPEGKSDLKATSNSNNSLVPVNSSTTQPGQTRRSTSLVARKPVPKVPVPQWHAPWELSAVVSGHLGWVRCIAFDPSNEWFVTGSADRSIKVWDLAKVCAGAEGGLKLTLTGHISAVRGLVVSPRHPYMFSVGEDKKVMCWDLEYNKVTRHYHGHLSGVFCAALHPILDVLITGGRDSVARVWDIRTKNQVHVLSGHGGTISSLVTNSVDPQVITGSHDSTVKLWDLAAGRSMATLTQHKKSVRAVVHSPQIRERIRRV